MMGGSDIGVIFQEQNLKVDINNKIAIIRELTKNADITAITIKEKE